MIRCIKTELRKCLYPPFFLLTVLGTLVLCLLAIGEYDYTGKSLTILEMMVQGVEEDSVYKSGLVLWIQGCSGWLLLLLPLLASFGYLVTLTSERQSGEIGNLLIRMGNLRYCVGKMLGGALAGGIGFVLGYSLFGVVMLAAFPDFSGFSAEDQMFYLQMYGASGTAEFVIKHLAGIFLYGFFVSVFGMGVAIAVRDKYMLLCLPFLLNYIYTQVLQKLLTDSFEKADGTSEIIWIFSMTTVINVAADIYWVLSVVFMAAVYGVVGFLFYLEVKKRGCNG